MLSFFRFDFKARISRAFGLLGLCCVVLGFVSSSFAVSSWDAGDSVRFLGFRDLEFLSRDGLRSIWLCSFGFGALEFRARHAFGSRLIAIRHTNHVVKVLRCASIGLLVPIATDHARNTSSSRMNMPHSANPTTNAALASA